VCLATQTKSNHARMPPDDTDANANATGRPGIKGEYPTKFQEHV